MTYEQRAAFYRRSVDASLEQAFTEMAIHRITTDCTLDDEMVIQVALMNRLRDLADEAEARVNMGGQIARALGDG